MHCTDYGVTNGTLVNNEWLIVKEGKVARA
jgi:hypothetical protein